MALPTKANLQTMDYSYLGEPFCYVPAKQSITLDGMDYSYLAEPFWGIGEAEVEPEPVPEPCEGSVLLNGGFEAWTEGSPDDWSGGTQEAVIVHSGDYSLSTFETEVNQALVLSDGCYTLDFWYNCDVVEQGAFWYLVKLCGEDAFCLNIDGIWNLLIDDPYQYLPATSGWENVVVDFTADGYCSYLVGFGTQNEGNTAYFDDVCLYPCEEPSGEDALSATCGESLFKLDILRQRIRTDGTNYYLVVK